MVNIFDKNQCAAILGSLWKKVGPFALCLWNFIKLLFASILALKISTCVLCFFERNRIVWDMPAMIFVIFMVCWFSFPFHPSKEDIKSIVRARFSAFSQKPTNDDDIEDSPQSSGKIGPGSKNTVTEQNKTPNSNKC